MRQTISASVVVLFAVVATALGFAAGTSGAQAPDDFSIIVIPDTQKYLDDNAPQPQGAALFDAQVDWVINNAGAERLVFASHVGDVVENPDRVSEWDRADAILQQLDAAGFPYAIAPGNHDLEPGVGPGLFDSYFPPARFEGFDWYDGYHEPSGNRASFQRLTAGGHRLLFIHVRHLDPTYGDPAPVLAWVTSVLQAHPAHLAFVTTHEFTETDGSIIYPALVAAVQDSCNVGAVLSGHRVAVARGTFVDTCGRTVHHLLTNYQGLASGGDALMRRIQVDPATLTAQSTVFSPALDSDRTGVDEQFAFSLAAPLQVFGDVDNSGSVTSADTQALLEELVGLEPAVFDDRVADMNGDEALSLLDALLLEQ